MIFSDFLKALSQTSDHRFIGVILKGVGITIALLAVLTLGVQFLLPDSISLPWIGEIAWLSTILSGFILISMVVGSVFLMVPVASLFTGLFLDQIADAVEGRHYPDVAETPRPSLMEGMRQSVRFLGLMLVVNLCALIIYLVSTVLAPFVFWAVNGYLLGREYFQMVAVRHMSAKDARDLRKRHGGQIFVAGVLMAVPLTIPILNLFVPVYAVATFTHLFHRINK